jgi:capping protein beta
MIAVEIDTTDENHPFLKTEFNRDGDNYRSPFTNIYYPENEAGYYPGGKWRELEQMGGLLFGEYIKLYYNEGLFSFYVLENEGDHELGRENFSCGFFVKKGTCSRI